MHDFDAAKKSPGAAKSLEPQHGSGAPLDCPMVLLDAVVEIFGLADLDRRLTISIDGFERGEIGTAFVDGHRLGDAILSDRFLKVTPGCSLVPMGAQQEVDGVAVLVDGPVEIFPVALDADVCLIHSPALSNWQLATAKRFLQYRQQLERPAMDGRMIDRRPTFGHHFFKMTQTQRIGDVPAHARQNHLQRIVQAFQYLGQRRV